MLDPDQRNKGKRIRNTDYVMFLTVLGLPDPDPLVRGTDPDPFNHKAKIDFVFEE
jgi:hypothetical protein